MRSRGLASVSQLSGTEDDVMDILLLSLIVAALLIISAMAVVGFQRGKRTGVAKNGSMKLAILGSRGIPALYGGFETFAEELSVRLVQRGIEVTVYCEAGAEEKDDDFRGVHLVHIPAPRFGPLTTILFDLHCLWHARKAFDFVYMLGCGTSLFVLWSWKEGYMKGRCYYFSKLNLAACHSSGTDATGRIYKRGPDSRSLFCCYAD